MHEIHDFGILDGFCRFNGLGARPRPNQWWTDERPNNGSKAMRRRTMWRSARAASTEPPDTASTAGSASESKFASTQSRGFARFSLWTHRACQPTDGGMESARQFCSFFRDLERMAGACRTDGEGRRLDVLRLCGVAASKVFDGTGGIKECSVEGLQCKHYAKLQLFSGEHSLSGGQGIASDAYRNSTCRCAWRTATCD